jgi:hypothetical protein
LPSRFRFAPIAGMTAGMTAGALLLALVGAPSAAAHSAQAVGDFHLEVGWLNEPALVGQPNAVQLAIKDHDDAPVTDLGPDELTVRVSTGGQDSADLPLLAAFDAAEGEGPLGEYHAELIPTAPGDYSFHFTGKIHDTAVDLTVASGAETFDPVVGSSDLEFPVKQPTLTEVGTRLDRIDGRIGALQSAAPGTDALAAAKAAADAAAAASAAADRALLLGLIVGGAGIAVAIVALVVASRATRKATGPA